ncbi:MAG: Asp-tRNA(Asn)/Glu-tRNA(Gln) amidotransferase subunit GatC [Atribacterota bacterium]|nr:Asp-tRNA(Asn)/Glu-tRNA(Gln) amidotransferase subunit GatC [Atribacterota bacterium]
MSEKIIDKKDVEYVAQLAKLELSEEQKELYVKQFNDILTYFKKLNELDTREVSPTSQILHSNLTFHEDIPRPSLPQEKVMNLTNSRKDGYFKVPKTL